MRTFKRNAVIIVVALFVCVAAYLNWSYNRNNGGDTQASNPEASPQVIPVPVPSAGTGLGEDGSPDGEAPPDGAEDPGDGRRTDGGLFFDASASQAGQFADARLSRQSARDAAVATLSSVNETGEASQEVVDESLRQIMQIAEFSQREVELETLIKAKGFSDCVVFLSNDNIRVTVPAPMSGLAVVDVAKITDIVVSDTEYKADQLNIIEIR